MQWWCNITDKSQVERVDPRFSLWAHSQHCQQESIIVYCFLVTFRNTTEHDQKTADDNDSRAGEWDDADDWCWWLMIDADDNDSRAGEWDYRRGLRLPQTTQPTSNIQGVHSTAAMNFVSNLPIILSSSNATSCYLLSQRSWVQDA